MLQSQIRRRLLPIALCFAGVLPPAFAQFGENFPQAVPGESPISEVLQSVDADARRYHQHITTLSNPYFEGRAPGLAGNRRAAEYIEFWFKKLNVGPGFPPAKGAAGDETSYRQPFLAGGMTRVTKITGTWTAHGETGDFKPGSEITALEYSGNGDAEGDVVFVGYSIADGQDGYRSYRDDDNLRGKVAMVFRFEPMTAEGWSRWAPRGWSPAASIDDKIRGAVERGASAVVLVNPPGCADPRSRRMMDGNGSFGGGQSFPVPVIMMDTEAAGALLKAGGQSIEELRDKANEGRTVVTTNARLAVSTKLAREGIETDNVVGLIPGTGTLKNEYIIVGAHYDHVGYGDQGGSLSNQVGVLHPGADDNGSGTCATLLVAEKVAKAFSERDDANRRSVIFLLFSAEEMGLIGSQYYVSNPTVPLDTVSLMINMDMVGRLRGGKLEVEGVETAAGLEDFAQPLLDASGMTIAKVRPTPNSDHASFRNKGVPIMNFFTGYHDVYHRPGDTFETINSVGAAKIASLVTSIVTEAAVRDEKFVFQDGRRRANAPAPANKDDAAQNRPQRLQAVPLQPPEGGSAVASNRVRFGVMPGDYDGTTKGVLVGDVMPGTSAEAAGFKSGDVIKVWNGKAVDGVEDWMPLLAAHKPGDVVEIEFVRGGKTMKTSCTLLAR